MVRADDRDVSEADATTGLVREQAMADDDVWVGVARPAPGRPSGWHHHGEHETYFYVQTGKIRMEYGPGGSNAIEAGPGDFVHVPGGLIHREVNSSSKAGSVILARVGSGPPVINVEGPEPEA